MRSFPSFLRHLMAVLVLACSTGAALAGPTYHVSIDTSAFAATPGAIGFYLSRQVGAPQSTATLSNFAGAFGATVVADGDISGAIPGSVVFGSTDGESFLAQAASFGSLFSFDVEFGGDFASTTSSLASLFGIALFNADLTAYLGAQTDLIVFNLIPMVGVTVDTFADIASVSATAVPEPSELVLMLTGLAMMGFVVRRRKVAAR